MTDKQWDAIKSFMEAFLAKQKCECETETFGPGETYTTFTCVTCKALKEIDQVGF